MSWSRRRFLAFTLGAGAASLGTSAFLFKLRIAQPGRRHFFVPSPESYWNSMQDFSRSAGAPTVSVPGVPPASRSLLTIAREDGSELRQAFVPGAVHSVRAANGLLYLITVDPPAALYALNPNTLELVAQADPGPNLFGGHLVITPDGSQLLAPLNTRQEGHFDQIGVFDARTLRLVRVFSTHGFQAHELALGANGNLYVGHYGSYLGSGPYKAYAFTSVNGKNIAAAPAQELQGTYPACVSVINVATGELIGRRVDRRFGPAGHLAVARDGNIFLTQKMPAFEELPSAAADKAFQEGARVKGDSLRFISSAVGTGTTIVLDEKHGQALAPLRNEGKLLCVPFTNPAGAQIVDLQTRDPQLGLVNGLCLHPDGDSYIVSTNRGFLAFGPFRRHG